MNTIKSQPVWREIRESRAKEHESIQTPRWKLSILHRYQLYEIVIYLIHCCQSETPLQRCSVEWNIIYRPGLFHNIVINVFPPPRKQQQKQGNK